MIHCRRAKETIIDPALVSLYSKTVTLCGGRCRGGFQGYVRQGIPVAGVRIFGGRTELTEVHDTGVEVVRNLSKCRWY